MQPAFEAGVVLQQLAMGRDEPVPNYPFEGNSGSRFGQRPGPEHTHQHQSHC
jgi:hypothetical protein